MARSINRLSDRTVKSVTRPGRHADGGNLFLIVDPPRKSDTASGKRQAKRWAFIFRWEGKLKEMGLGSLTAVSLAQARRAASEARALLANNVNPIEARWAEERRKLAAGRTFGEAAAQFHESHKGAWKSQKVEKQWLPSLERYCGPIWSKNVETITTEDVLAVLKPIWTSKAETARRTRGRIEAILDAARARGLIDRDRANPAAWKGHLDKLLPKPTRLQRGHHAALPYARMAEFMASLRAREAMAALCLEFLALTAVRSGEAMNARWSEIDLDAALWVIPRERMKRNREHRVPLSDRCVAILRKLEPLKTDPDGFVFPGTKAGRPLSVMALEMLLRRMKLDGVTTVHGLRSTFREWCGDCTTFPREIAEEALAHQVGSAVERAYRRGDAIEKRRQLMQAWADYCAGANNVVALMVAG
jgi:integrase